MERDDPLIALMSAVEQALAPYMKKPGKLAAVWKATKSDGARIAGKIAVAAAKTAVKRFVGENLEDLISSDEGPKSEPGETAASKSASDDIIGSALEEATKEISSLTDRAADALIAKFNTTRKSITGFRDNLGSMTRMLAERDVKAPLFILVDELDRCRPTYAISLLERTKHLFEADGVAFIFATDSGQLQHTVRGVYGGDFDGKKYLSRFFDRRYVFREPKVAQLVASRLGDVDQTKLVGAFQEPLEAIQHGFQSLQPMPLRSIEQIIEIMAATTAAWSAPVPIETATLLVFSACYHERHDFDFTAYLKPYEANWMAVLPDRYDDNGRQVAIDVFAAIRTLLSRSINLREALTSYQGSTNASDELIFNYFESEASKSPRSTYGPSILQSLPALIQNAGRILQTEL